MAEFPELGKNCSMKSCNRLGGGEHRLSHGCKQSSEATTSNASASASSPLRPYLCAMDGCHLRESVRVECPNCKRNFCLRHRHNDQHNCEYSNENTEKEKRKAAWAEVQKKIESSRTYVCSEEAVCEFQPKKVLNEVEQKRADRIAIMRLKLKAKECDIPLAEQMFLIVVTGDKRIPIMVSKHWTVGKCVDKVASELNTSNNNADYGAKMLRLYCLEDESNALPMADNVTKHLKDMATVSLKRDQ
ncbi:AN1-type zinc finger protein 1 [Toxocara canis]|uniref:AN1-type zinc finger protein 1 n=1 Tax=Toxocara canis TaxID=6265 RepID=A0A0B2V0V5_TOXCA|nr:AN1-type zinc finger protein 1 [Toxocara canis]